MSDPEALEAAYQAVLGPYRAAERGRLRGEFLERELRLARDGYLGEVIAAVADPAADPPRLATRLARHLLDYPPLVEDPLTGDLEVFAEGLTEGPDPAFADLGARILKVLRRLRESRRLLPPRPEGAAAPLDASLDTLLDEWPPCDVGDRLQRAKVEYHKGLDGDRRARRRVAAAAVRLAVATPWDPWHPWRLALLEAAAAFAPSDADVSFQLARHHKAYGEMAAARRLCRRAIEQDPAAPEPRVMLGGLLEFSARPREARAVYERVLKMRGGGPPAPGRARAERGAFSSGSGIFRRPETARRKARVTALEGLARLRVAAGDWRGAVRALVEQARMAPGATRPLKALAGLARGVAADHAAARIADELKARGGGGLAIPPPGFDAVDAAELRGFLEAEARF